MARITKEKADAIRSLAGKGMHLRAIEREVHVNHSAIKAWAERNGVSISQYERMASDSEVVVFEGIRYIKQRRSKSYNSANHGKHKTLARAIYEYRNPGKEIPKGYYVVLISGSWEDPYNAEVEALDAKSFYKHVFERDEDTRLLHKAMLLAGTAAIHARLKTDHEFRARVSKHQSEAISKVAADIARKASATKRRRAAEDPEYKARADAKRAITIAAKLAEDPDYYKKIYEKSKVTKAKNAGN